MLERLVVALVAGVIIGWERGYHGHAAGVRTHALVSLASAMLMLVTVFQDQWMTDLQVGRITLDPTRMAQGIMTGIGFLGAGVIMKDGLSVRGLTTAASIRVTAALGIHVGIGLYFVVGAVLALVLITLLFLDWLEDRLPTRYRGMLTVAFAAPGPPEAEVRALLHEHGFHSGGLNYRIAEDGERVEFRLRVWSRDPSKVSALRQALQSRPGVCSFNIRPISK